MVTFSIAAFACAPQPGLASGSGRLVTSRPFTDALPKGSQCPPLFPCNGIPCPVVAGADQSLCSTNWSGYVVTGDAGTVSAVNGSWTVPPVVCQSVGDTNLALWVGIDGYNSSTVEQVGTYSACIGGSPSYWAWYQFTFNGSVAISSVRVSAGNDVWAGVRYDNLTGEFTSWIRSSGGGSNSTSARVPGAPRSSAEWIVERPEYCVGQRCWLTTLSKFGTTGFGPGATATVGNMTGPIRAFPDVALTLLGSKFGPILAWPSSLTAAGSFMVGEGGTIVTVGCNPSPAIVGSPSVCQADVAAIDVPSGMITWSSNGTGKFSRTSCWISEGSCSTKYTPGPLPTASLTLKASYSHDSYNGGSFGTYSLTVAQKPTETSVLCAKAVAKEGVSQTFECTAAVSGYSPSGGVRWSQSGGGLVSFASQSCVLSRGRCSVVVTGTAAGAVKVGASYSGDESNLMSSGSSSLTVGLAKPSLSLNCGTQASVGRETSCTAGLRGYLGNVTGEELKWLQTSGAGEISFGNQTCALSRQGTCTVTISGTKTGQVVIEGTFAGDANNAQASRKAILKVTG